MGLKGQNVRAAGITLAGIVALEWAAYETGNPGFGGLVRDVFGSSGIGEGANIMWECFREYAQDFVYDWGSFAGTLGQACIYGGLLKILYSSIEEYIKDKPGEAE